MCDIIDMHEYDQFLEGLGLGLRMARETRGLDLDRAASEISISSERLELFEGGVMEPQSTVVGDLARLYGVSADWLVGTATIITPGESAAM